MGGEYYERQVYSVQNVESSENKSKAKSMPEPTFLEQSFSDQALKALNQNSLDKSNDPKRFADESRKLICKHKNPIVFALDVSASMGYWPLVFIFYIKHYYLIIFR